MLSDRPYMREAAYPRQRTSVLTWLIAAILAVFILQSVILHWFGDGNSMRNLFALSVGDLREGKVWKLLTYGFLHDQRNLLHVIANVLALYFLGREVLPLLGSRRFLAVFGSAIVLGGLCWSATHWNSGGTVMLIGASGGIMALLALFACFFPNQPITFLLFFIFPITIRPKILAIIVAGFDLAGLLLYEIPGGPSPFSMAHSAHLGGFAAGLIYFRYFHEARWLQHRSRASIELPAWLKKSRKVAPAAYRVDVPQRGGDLKAEVDRILDKINSQGFSALTPEEKRLLGEARDLLSRR